MLVDSVVLVLVVEVVTAVVPSDVGEDPFSIILDIHSVVIG